MEKKLQEGVDTIKKDYVDNVIEYLKTGVFNQPSNKKFMGAYSYLLL